VYALSKDLPSDFMHTFQQLWMPENIDENHFPEVLSVLSLQCSLFSYDSKWNPFKETF